MNLSLRLSFSLLLATLCLGCAGKSRGHGGAIDTGPLPNGETLSDDEARNLVARGAAVYWSFNDMQTTKQGTGKARRLVMIDPAKLTTMKALRTRIATVFTEAAADSMIADYSVVAQDGKLWMRPADADDIRDYDDVSIVEVRGDSSGAAIAKVEVPLGESGQSDMVAIRFRKTATGWKIANYIFDDEPVSEESDDVDDADSIPSP